jgi:hypothetical protein
LKAAVVVFGLLLALPARAADLPSLAALSQGEFRQLSEDLGAALAYKGVIPATALGPLGFDIAVGVSATEVRHGGVFARAGNRDSDALFVPKVQVSKGLPFGLDLGAFVGVASNVDTPLLGADLRYALVNDGVAMPAVALRLSGTRLGEVGGLRLSTAAADVLVSKRLAVVTPFIGAGVVRTRARFAGDALAEESFNRNRLFVGLNVNLVLLNVALEAEKLGDNTSLSAKAGWRF